MSVQRRPRGVVYLNTTTRPDHPIPTRSRSFSLLLPVCLRQSLLVEASSLGKQARDAAAGRQLGARAEGQARTANKGQS